MENNLSNSTKRYLSCDLIENGFDFNVRSINFCCRPGAGKAGFKAIIPDYKGEPVDWDNFFEIKNNYRKQLQNGIMIPECEDCVYLYENDWNTGNYISNLNFNHGIVCNAKCFYCYLDDFRKKNPKFKAYKILPVIKDMVAKNILKNNGVITIAGGEPTIDPEFEKLIHILMNVNVNNIRVLTNGIKYSKMIEKAINKGIMSIVVSTDSGSKKIFETIKRVQAYDKVWKNIKKYAKAQKNSHQVKTKYIIIPGINHHKTEINAWLDKNIECGIKEVAIDIELVWFSKNYNNLQQNIYDVLNYAIEQAQTRSLIVEPGDRAVILMKKQNNTHGLIFQGKEL